MAAYRRVDDLTVTCRLTACTPGSAPGTTLGIEYGKPLPLPLVKGYSTTTLLQTYCCFSYTRRLVFQRYFTVPEQRHDYIHDANSSVSVRSRTLVLRPGTHFPNNIRTVADPAGQVSKTVEITLF